MADTEITSPPAFREETVTDIDFSYASGLFQGTLREGDTINTPMSGDLSHYSVHKLARNGSPEEDIVLYTRHLEWVSMRTRVIKWPIDKPVTVSPTPSADATGEP